MNIFGRILVSIGLLFLSNGVRSQTSAGVPVFKIVEEDSSIKFAVKVSLSIEGAFDKWNSTLPYTSTDADAGVLGKDYGMNGSIPFIRIADRVEVTLTSKLIESAALRWSSSSSCFFVG